MAELPRKWVLVDSRGRCTLPKYLLKAIGIDMDNIGNASLLVEAYPNLEKPSCLIVKKGIT